MISGLPYWTGWLFGLAWAVSVLVFYRANGRPKVLTIGILVWSAGHSIAAYSGYYQNTEAMPPRFGLVLLPAFLGIGLGLLPRARRWVYRQRDLGVSTFLHIVRVPVEIVLFQLYLQGMVPELMTFEGWNLDILAGLSAPFIGYLYLKNKISPRLMIAWNLAGLLLVSFILVTGILSAELPIQQLAFDQPNRALAYFPFILLPAVIVPLVLWTHITDILKLRHPMHRSSNTSA